MFGLNIIVNLMKNNNKNLIASCKLVLIEIDKIEYTLETILKYSEATQQNIIENNQQSDFKWEYHKLELSKILDINEIKIIDRYFSDYEKIKKLILKQDYDNAKHLARANYRFTWGSIYFKLIELSK